MRQFFEHIKKSVYGPEYYREILAHPLSYSLKYYLALALFVAVFLTIVSSIPLVPQVNQAVRDFPQKIFTYYPDQLEITIDKGVASSNVPEPFMLPVVETQEPRSGEVKDGSFLVIDTTTPYTLEQFRAYKAAIWLGGGQLVVDDGSGGVRIVPFNENTNITINEPALRNFEQRLQPFYNFIAPLVVLVIFFGLLIGFSFNLLYLIFAAILIFLLGRLLKQRWSYGASYRIGLHAITLPFLLFVFISLLSFPPFDLPFLYTLVMLGVVFVNFKEAASSSPAASDELASEDVV